MQIKKKCKKCRKEFSVKKSQDARGRGKFCSVECMKVKKLNCLDCGKILSDRDGKRCQMCYGSSLKGKTPWNKGKRGLQIAWNKGKVGSIKANKGSFKRGDFLGEKHPMWKGGITPLVRRIRNCFEYRQWRSDIFQRDDYTCQKCGLRGVTLHADHHPRLFSEIFNEYKIKTFEQALECFEFWNMNNGRTLCAPCHELYGRRK